MKRNKFYSLDPSFFKPKLFATYNEVAEATFKIIHALNLNKIEKFLSNKEIYEYVELSIKFTNFFINHGVFFFAVIVLYNANHSDSDKKYLKTILDTHFETCRN